jgi:hypothetical protein
LQEADVPVLHNTALTDLYTLYAEDGRVQWVYVTPPRRKAPSPNWSRPGAV